MIRPNFFGFILIAAAWQQRTLLGIHHHLVQSFSGNSSIRAIVITPAF